MENNDQMMLGQHSHIFPDVELPARLGGHSDLPPNIAPATEQDFWRVVSLGLWRIIDRQPRVAADPWNYNRDLIQIKHEGSASPRQETLTNVKLFTRPDLSGVMVVLTHHHARLSSDDAIWGRYEPRFFTFAACRHMTTTSKGDAYSSLIERRCEECGFWTQIDSGD